MHHQAWGPGRVAGGEGVPGREEGVSTGLEEAAGALGLGEVPRARSKGLAEGRWAQRLALWWAGPEPPQGG